MHADEQLIETIADAGWRSVLAADATQSSFLAVQSLLQDEARVGAVVYPPLGDRFAALACTPLDSVRVVVVGQDPYHQPGQAMGLAFSVPRGVTVPPSLRNLFTELEQDLGIPRPAHGDLTGWAEQGVLLINTTLTVRAGEPGSHAGKGWEAVTDALIRAVSDRREHVVFLLWGRHAQSKRGLIDATRHAIFDAAHPSPLSASRGFFGCRHFSRANAYLAAQGYDTIDWSLAV